MMNKDKVILGAEHQDDQVKNVAKYLQSTAKTVPDLASVVEDRVGSFEIHTETNLIDLIPKINYKIRPDQEQNYVFGGDHLDEDLRRAAVALQTSSKQVIDVIRLDNGCSAFFSTHRQTGLNDLMIQQPNVTKPIRACVQCFQENQGEKQLQPAINGTLTCESHRHPKSWHWLPKQIRVKGKNYRSRRFANRKYVWTGRLMVAACLVEGCQKFLPSTEMKGKLSLRTAKDHVYCLIPEHLAFNRKHARFGCHYCDKTFVSSATVMPHERVHTGSRPFVCNVTNCGKSFFNSGTLRGHRFTHTSIRAFMCKVAHCGKAFKNPATLRDHQRVHNNVKPYICSNCPSTFKTGCELQVHFRVHSKSKPYKCLKMGCGKRFAQNGHLIQHRRCHTGNKPYKCHMKSCQKAFAQQSTLQVHEATHLGKRPFRCIELGCTGMFTQKHHLSRHVKAKHEPKPVILCEHCSEAFTSQVKLWKHLKQQHQNLRLHKCKECIKTFVTAEVLQQHRDEHFKKKRYQCPECDKMFSRSTTLKEHLNVHTGVRLFQCEECLQSFFRKRTMLKHHQVHFRPSSLYPVVCDFASYATYHARPGDLRCDRRFKDQRRLDYHTQAFHTTEGLAKKLKAEQQTADFLTANNVAFTRDRENMVKHKTCTSIMPAFSGSHLFPDFFLYKIPDMYVLLGVDEYCHRSTACDLHRTLKLTTAVAANSREDLTRRIVYLRWNPHRFDNAGVSFDPCLAERHKQLLLVIERITAGEVELKPNGLSLIYMYYDRESDGRLSIFANPGDENAEFAAALEPQVVHWQPN